ncbi:MAG: ribose 5-phosphate isomerase A [Simkaniaceae bacterium]|nr:ribose 5-phosphate isomerase A [Simkaniaceae bacterium]
MAQDDMKRLAGYQAADLVQSGMKLGIGTGTTVYYFIERLIERVRDGLTIEAAFTSNRSEEQAGQGGIFSLPNDQIIELDLCVDGADEIDGQMNMIKGGGGALTREKIIASSAKEMVVIVDESKCVQQLGTFPLPVEIIPFAPQTTIKKINDLGFFGTLRHNEEHDLYITDNHNYIYDLKLDPPIGAPRELHQKLITLPGVVETGLFFDLAKRLIIGGNDGKIHTR